jgi:cell wall-associated NlpC family hydrolase
MTPRRIRRLGAYVVVASLLGLLASSWIGAGQAFADPISEKRSEAARIAQQLQSQNVKIDQLAEAMDQARLQADTLQAQVVTTQARLAQTEARAQQILSTLRVEAVTLYVTGGQTGTLQAISHNQPSDLVISQAYASHAFSDQRDALDQMRSIDKQLHDVRAQLATEQKAAADAIAKVAAAEHAAEAQQAAEQRTLHNVQGQLIALVAAEQQRLAAAAAARVQAELAARAAAMAAAARAEATQIVSGPSGGGGGGGGFGSGSIGTAPAPVPAPSGGAAAAVAAAQAELGKPYVWGGAGPDSFDCSGLTMWAWRAGGVSLAHGATAQYYETAHVPLGAAEPGDLIFYGNPSYVYHVGIYVGGGQMIEAEHTGTVVHYASIYRSDLMPVAGRP